MFETAVKNGQTGFVKLTAQLNELKWIHVQGEAPVPNCFVSPLKIDLF